MPNSCNSITKIISIFLLIFLGSCTSISHSTFSERVFIGKLSFTNTQSRSNYNVRVNALPEKVIIQIGKPLFGNLLKIEFDNSTGLSFDPQIDNDYLYLLQSFNNKDYINFFNSCFGELNIEKNMFIIKKHDFELKCNYQNNATVSVYMTYKTNLKIIGLLKSG